MVGRVASARPQLVHKLITGCVFTTFAGENISREKGKKVSSELFNLPVVEFKKTPLPKALFDANVL